MSRGTRLAFSLVELMIVIAIVAFLATISIPSYFKYLAKAKQTEVALNLASLHAAELSYWASNGTYSAKLAGSGGVGWEPAGYKAGHKPNFYYTYGFQSSDQTGGISYFVGKLNTSVDHLKNTFANNNDFVAAAAADLLGNGHIDIWTIDENRNITHVEDGLA